MLENEAENLSCTFEINGGTTNFFFMWSQMWIIGDEQCVNEHLLHKNKFYNLKNTSAVIVVGRLMRESIWYLCSVIWQQTIFKWNASFLILFQKSFAFLCVKCLINKWPSAPLRRPHWLIFLRYLGYFCWTNWKNVRKTNQSGNQHLVETTDPFLAITL